MQTLFRFPKRQCQLSAHVFVSHISQSGVSCKTKLWLLPGPTSSIAATAALVVGLRGRMDSQQLLPREGNVPKQQELCP